MQLIGVIAEGAPGHGPVHLLLQSASLSFRWNEGSWCWDRPALPVLSLFTGPTQHFYSAVLERCRNCVSTKLCGRKGLGVDLTKFGMLLPSHVRDGDKGLLRGILSGEGMERFFARKGPRRGRY